MKKIISFLSLFFIVFGLVAQTRVTAPMVHNNPSDSSYATHIDSLGKGGLIVFTDMFSRDNLPASQRKRGMIAVIQDSILYQLQGGIANSNWVHLNIGAGVNIDSLLRDTLYSQLPLYFYIDSLNRTVIAIQRADDIITPGYVTHVSGLLFSITPATYVLGGVYYASPADTIRLDPADPTFSRIDLFAVDTSGRAIKITGTPGAIPLTPQIAIGAQLALTTGITIHAGDTTLTTVVSEMIYDENVEWVTGTQDNPSVVDFNSTANAYSGSKAAFISKYTYESQLRFVDGAYLQNTVQPGETLSGYIYLNGALPTGNDIYFQLYDTSNATTNAIALGPAYGFNRNDSNAYKQFVIPLSAFSFARNKFTTLIITMIGYDTSGAKGFYLDRIQLQYGVPNVPPPASNRFGIEDNTGVQDRNVDMQGFNFGIDNLGSFYTDVTTDGDLFSSLNLGVASNSEHAILQIATNSTGEKRTLLVGKDNIQVQQTESTGVGITNQTFSKPATGDYYIPLSVTDGGGIHFADTTGNITISGGGSTPNLQQVTDVGNRTNNDVYMDGGDVIMGQTTGIRFRNNTDSNAYSLLRSATFPVNTTPNAFNLPDIAGTDKTLAISVNNNFADSTGNITIPGGGSGTDSAYVTRILCPDSSCMILVHSNRAIPNDTTYFASGGSGGGSGGSSGWSLTGNAGTTSSNFLGTTDNTPLRFGVYNANSGILGTDTLGVTANTSIGFRSLFKNTTGDFNTVFGSKSLFSNTTGNASTGLGYQALFSNTTGSWNIALGASSLYFNTTGQENTATGYKSMYKNTTGSWNTGFGLYSLYNNLVGIYNNAIGFKSLYFNTGSLNQGIGAYSLYFNTSGYSNSSNGDHSLYNNTTGHHNSAIGDSSIYTNTTGNYNIGLGFLAGNTNSTSSNTLYVSDSAYHMQMKLDSVAGSAPSVIGKDASGNWHTYATPVSSGTYIPGSRTYSGVAVSSGSDGTIIYSRVGNVVTVSGFTVIIGSGVAGSGYVTFDLPISTNLSSLSGGGTAVGSLTGVNTRYPGQVTISGTPGKATISMDCPAAASFGLQTVFTFQYQIQ